MSTKAIEIEVEEIGMIKGYPLYYSDDFSSPMGLARFEGQISVIVGPMFHEFTRLEQEVMFFHEMGHVIYGHLGRTSGRDFDKEVQADSMAIAVCGKERVIATLRKYQTLSKSQRAIAEVDRRIAVIEAA